MATVNGINYAKTIAQEKLGTTESHGRIRVSIDEATFGTTAAVGDIHLVGWLPEDARITRIVLVNMTNTTATGTATCIVENPGASADADRFFSIAIGSGTFLANIRTNTDATALIASTNSIVTTILGDQEFGLPTTRMKQSGPVAFRWSALSAAAQWNSRKIGYIIYYVLD